MSGVGGERSGRSCSKEGGTGAVEAGESRWRRGRAPPHGRSRCAEAILCPEIDVKSFQHLNSIKEIRNKIIICPEIPDPLKFVHKIIS